LPKAREKAHGDGKIDVILKWGVKKGLGKRKQGVHVACRESFTAAQVFRKVAGGNLGERSVVVTGAWESLKKLA